MYIIINTTTNRQWETDSRTEACLYAMLGETFSTYAVFSPSKKGGLPCAQYDL